MAIVLFCIIRLAILNLLAVFTLIIILKKNSYVVKLKVFFINLGNCRDFRKVLNS